MGKKPLRAAAIEGVRWYFAEDRPRGPAPKPFFLTYTGDDVVEIPGVGKFQNGTTAEVDAETARACEGRPDWIVRERPRPAGESEDEGAGE